MAAFNPNAETSFEQIPEGIYLARCVRVIELGDQASELYPDPKPKAQIVLSIPAHTVTVNGEEKQSFISNLYGITMSSSDRSTMKQYTRALDPKGQATSINYFLDQPCQVTVKHNQKGRAVIDSIAPVVPGTEVPAVDTPLLYFSQVNPDPEVWAQVPEITKQIIKEAVSYPGSKVEAMVKSLEAEQPEI